MKSNIRGCLFRYPLIKMNNSMFAYTIFQLFLSWNDDITLSEVTKPRYGSVYPWPLNVILSWKKKNQVMKKLAALGWATKTLEEVWIPKLIVCPNSNSIFTTLAFIISMVRMN